MMAEGIVQGLEIVQLDRTAAPASGRSRSLAARVWSQPLQQQAAVGQAGQRIVVGQGPDVVLRRLDVERYRA